MATKRKAAKSNRKPGTTAKRGFVTIKMPRPTAALLASISTLVRVPEDHLIVALVNELGEQIAKLGSKPKATRMGLLQELLKLPAFREALLDPPPRKRSATRSAKRPR